MRWFSGEGLGGIFQEFGGSGEAELYAHFSESSYKFFKVLAREDLRRRHVSGLISVFHGGKLGGDGDRGFSASDVAFQKTGHRFRFGEVFQNMTDGFSLRAGKFKRESFYEIFNFGGRGFYQKRRMQVPFSAVKLPDELDYENFLKGESFSRGLGPLELAREMNFGKRGF